MAHVDIIIAGRSYQMACRAGDEPNLRALGQQVDAKAAQARQILGGGASEGRLLLLAAMMLADEANDLRGALDQASAASAPSPRDSERDLQIAEAIDEVSERLERLAQDLEGGADTP